MATPTPGKWYQLGNPDANGNPQVATPSVAQVSGNLIAPTAQPSAVQQGVSAMEQAAAQQPYEWQTPKAYREGWDKVHHPDKIVGSPFITDVLNYGKGDIDVLKAGVKDLNHMSGQVMDRAVYPAVDYFLGTHLKPSSTSSAASPSVQAASSKGTSAPAAGGVTITPPTAENPTGTMQTAGDAKAQPMEQSVNQMYAPDLTARILRDLQFRQAYGAAHGQSKEALENDYNRTMASLANVQSAFQQHDDAKRAREAGLVSADGTKTLPIDKDGKLLAGAGSVTDERGNITAGPDLGKGTQGFDPKGRASMIYRPQPGVVIYKPLSNQVTGPVDTRALAQQALDDKKTNDFIREQDRLIASGKDAKGQPINDEEVFNAPPRFRQPDTAVLKAMANGTYSPGAPGTINGVPGQQYLEDTSRRQYQQGIVDPDSPAGRINQQINERIRSGQGFGDLLKQLDAAAAQPKFNRSDVVLRPGPDASQFKGIVEQGNIDLGKRPILRNEDGSISTVKSMSFNDNGKEVLVPTIATDEKGNPVELSPQQAINRYRETGQHLGKFNSPQEANAYAQALHSSQAQYYRGAENYTGDGKGPVTATPESIAKYITARRQVEQAASPLPTREQMEKGFTVPGATYPMGRNPLDRPGAEGAKLPGINAYSDQIRSQQQAEQARWAKINAQKQMEEAMQPQPNGDPLRDAKIARDRAEAAKALAAANGEDPNDAQATSKYLQAPNSFNATNSTRDMNSLAMQHLRGDPMEQIVRSAVFNNAGGTPYDRARNIRATKQIEDLSSVDAREAAIQNAEERARVREESVKNRQEDRKDATMRERLKSVESQMQHIDDQLKDLEKDPASKKLSADTIAQFKAKKARLQKEQKDLNGKLGYDIYDVDGKEQPGQAGGTTPQPNPALPPKDQLKAGQVYDTLRGKAKWDGKQFVTI